MSTVADLLPGLRTKPADQPVMMVNLLQFQESRGRDNYLRYTREVAPHLHRVGARVVYAGEQPSVLIGEGNQPWWDAILVVEYPTPQAFMDMIDDAGYQQVHEYRAAALTRGDLIATSAWSISEPAGIQR